MKLLMDRIEQEYKDFTNNRKRWKSDFSLATTKATQMMTDVSQTLKSTSVNSSTNSAAIKMLLDSQMIEQLI